MGQPWSALTEALTGPFDRVRTEERFREAWLETAARLDLVRLGFVPHESERDLGLAYPCERAVARWRAAATLGDSGSSEETEEVIVIDRPAGRLIAGARRGRPARRSDLHEIARLCSIALERDRDAREREEHALRAKRGRAAAGSVHDIRNELTLALMYAQRAGEADGAGQEGLQRALRAARDLAHEALVGEAPLLALRQVPLQPLITREASAALGAARRPDEALPPPRLRVKCPAESCALVDPRGFGRALRNVLTNAAEATLRRGPGREVRITVRPLADAAPGSERAASALSAGSLRRAGYGLELLVEDEGAGMSRADLARYLQPRLKGRATASSTGFGTASLEIGLTQSSVPMRIESRPGFGTRLSLFLRSEAPREVVHERDVRRAQRIAAPGRAVVASAGAARSLEAVCARPSLAK